MSDREKVINDLQMQIENLEERLAIVLEGQPEIVRCKDCKKRETIYCPFYWRYKGMKYDDWYCADGEKNG